MRSRPWHRSRLARTLRAACLGFVALVILPPTAVAASGLLPQQAQPCFEPWWHGVLERAERHAGEPRAVTAVRLLEPLVSTAADPEQVIAGLEALRAAEDVHPLVAAEIDALLAEIDRNRGRTASARARLARLGTVESFALSGPVSDPEQARAWLRERDTDARTVGAGPGGELPLDAYAYPPEDGFVVAAIELEVAAKTDVAIRFGADDRAELWIGGEPLLQPEGRHDAAFDQHAAGIRLSPGRHRVAWLVEQGEGAWTLRARLTRPDGGPLGDTVRVVDPEAPAEAAGLAAPPEEIAVRSLTGELRRSAERDGRGRSHLALDLALRQLPDRQHSEAIRLARAAAEADPDDPEAAWILARVETDPARARDALETVLASGRHDPAVVREMAHYYLRHGQATSSLRFVERGLAACEQGRDPYLEAWRVVLQDAAGFPEGAVARLERLAADFPSQPLVLERLGTLAGRVGMPGTARDALERLLAVRRLDGDTRRALIELHVRADDEDRVVALLEEAVAAEPLDLGWRLRFARHHLAEGDTAAAGRQLAAVRAIAPDHPAVARMEGEIALAAGRENQAAEAWRRALERGGESFADLRARLSTLTGGEDSFGERWAISLEQARKRFEQAEQGLDGDPAFVVLEHLDAFRLERDGRATQFRQMVVGVRHPEQSDAARSYSVTYSPTLQRATILDARLVRRDGSVVVAARSERALLPDPRLRMWYDTRVIQVGFPRLERGDVLEIRYRIHDRGPTNALGSGYFGKTLALGRAVPSLSSRVVIEAPRELPVRHRAVRMPSEPEVETLDEDGRRRTVIEIPRLPAYPDAPLAPPPIERLPYLLLGTVESWEELGSIYADLLRPQLRATSDLAEIVSEQTRGLTDDREIVERLYRWVLENTRYVALEFGIHAIKPYPTDLVLRRRHGDCKDKASLLVTMLELAGVEARVALLRTRDLGEIDTSIPVFDAFNHAIVHVPGEDLWLDGTVLHHGAGELPLPDRETLALVIDPGEARTGSGTGELVRTPPADPSVAVIERTDQVVLERSGAAHLETDIAAWGEIAARERSRVRLADDPDNALQNHLERTRPELEVERTRIAAIDLGDAQVRYGYSGRLHRFAQRTGSTLSFRLSVEFPSLPLHIPGREREVGMWLPEPLTWRQRTVFVIPEGAEVTEVPGSKRLDSPWGTIEIEVRERRDRVVCDVEVVFGGGRVTRDELPRFAEFARDAQQALDQRVLLEWP